jgi:ATP-dependent Lon protease
LEQLHEYGVIGRVIRMIRQGDKGVVVLVHGEQRMRIKNVVQTEPFMKAEVETLQSQLPPKEDDLAEAALRNLRESAEKLLNLLPDVSDEVKAVFSTIEDASRLTDILAGNLSIEPKQSRSCWKKLTLPGAWLHWRYTSTASSTSPTCRASCARMSAAAFPMRRSVCICASSSVPFKRSWAKMAAVRSRWKTSASVWKRPRLPEKAKLQADRELKRLEVIPPQSPDHSVIVNYLETLAELPWNVLSDEKVDLHKAQEILDRDHHGLVKVKKRLIEYLAVRKLNPAGRGPILCFLGPPGVGKTSLGQSIAEALGRKFARISLGGLRDETEIRGHRRTYIGSMPGRLIQELKRLGTRNPVLMLDEIDKLGADFRGDPASALLEVLDPRQNQEFTDRYIDVPFDLSQIIFIATCNTLDTIPAPLRDRMEVVELPGYTEREKLSIAKNYLVKRQLSEHGLTDVQCIWSDEAIERVIEDYTREAGVRNLERQIASVTRHVAAQVAKEEITEAKVTPGIVREALGPAAFVRETKLQTSAPGVVTGLAYTTAGGEVLHIEAIRFPGKGGFTLTGQLGDVMKESVRAALSLVRSRAVQLGIDSFSRIASVVFITVSGLSEMLSMPCSTRNWANSG